MRYCKETFGVATNLHDDDWETPILFADKCHGRDAIVCWMAMGGIIEEARMSDSDTVLMTEGNW